MQGPDPNAVEEEALLEALLRHRDGEEVIVRFDRSSASWIVIAIHSTQWEPAVGGTRVKCYPDLRAAANDSLRLSAGTVLSPCADNCGGPKPGALDEASA